MEKQFFDAPETEREKQFKEIFTNYMLVSINRLKDGKIITCYEEIQEMKGMLIKEAASSEPAISKKTIDALDVRLQVIGSKLRDGKFFDAYDGMKEIIEMCG